MDGCDAQRVGYRRAIPRRCSMCDSLMNAQLHPGTYRAPSLSLAELADRISELAEHNTNRLDR
jgi:hypothetical protein